jgi:prephenate dehydrogenase
VQLREATVAIHGLGLMGGSLGLALQGKCARRIGVVRDADMVSAAEASGAVDEVTDMAVAFPAADIVVLALPVREIARMVPHVAAHMSPDALLTDLGSTKAAIVARMDTLRGGVQAVGGHPMCGREVGGLANADGSLYRGARYVLCPSSQSDEGAVDLARQLVLAVGATPVMLDATRHDRAAAVASHVPYSIAQSLVHALDDAEQAEPYAAELAATGFRDTTRIAAGDVTMWLDILCTNADAVADGLEGVERAIARLRDLLATGDEAALATWLTRGAERRRLLG